jgi:hypothetical protein
MITLPAPEAVQMANYWAVDVPKVALTICKIWNERTAPFVGEQRGKTEGDDHVEQKHNSSCGSRYFGHRICGSGE